MLNELKSRRLVFSLASNSQLLEDYAEQSIEDHSDICDVSDSDMKDILHYNSVKGSKRRLASFNPCLQGKYPFLSSIDSYKVKCNKCFGTFSIKYEGNRVIERHIKSKKHLNTLDVSSQISTLKSFGILSKTDSLSAANEATWSFHTVKHNQSFRSMDCTSPLIRKLFSSDFKCARTKSEAIVKKILAPYSLSLCVADLKETNFISIYTDQSNHSEIKCLPILVRYFSKFTGTSVRLIDFKSIQSETSFVLSENVLSTIKNFNLEQKIIALCADNTNTNFGGAARKGENNLHFKLKDQLNPNIIGIGCSAHIINNTIQTAVDLFPVEIDTVIIKIYSFFYIYTIRVESLMQFCDEADIEYRKLLGFSRTRWLSLLPTIERVLKLYPALKSYFLSLDNCPNMLFSFFSDPLSECWLLFVHNQASVFHSAVLLAENQKVTAFEVFDILVDIRAKMKNRYDCKFQPLGVKILLNKITVEEGISTKYSEESFPKFYLKAVQYIDKWIKTFEDFKDLQWLSLKSMPSWDQVQCSLALIARLIGNNFNIIENNLFDEFNSLSKLISVERLNVWQNSEVTSDLRWVEIFNNFKLEGLNEV